MTSTPNVLRSSQSHPSGTILTFGRMTRMKTFSMPLAMAVATLTVVLHPAACRAADEVVAFGLTHRPIDSAAVFLDPDYGELRVTNLSTFGYQGVSVELGQADFGLFFSPYTHASLENANFMIGQAFGLSAGIERRLASVFCERADWATYPVTVDFLPLGTQRKTVQAFADRTLLGEETYTNGAVTIFTSNSDRIGPRVNPLWRMPDGSVGVLLEFTEYPPVTLPSGRSAYANRIFIRADNPTSTVDYVSRVDIYGGGGLPEFSAIDERLGMFGLPHRALGDAVLRANEHKLTIANCANAGADGVLVELRHSPAFTAQLQPVLLASNGALFHISATATYDYYGTHQAGSFFGPLGIESPAGEKLLRVDAPGAEPREALVEILDGANRAGGFITTNGGYAGSFGTNDLEIISAGVIGGAGEHPASLYLQFREPATLTSAQGVLRGDSVRISPVGATNDIGTFVSFQLLACGVGPFTITNEVAIDPPPLNLTIERAGTNVLVSWPAYTSPYFYFETIGSWSPGGTWSNAIGSTVPFTRSRLLTRFPFQPASDSFFRLANPYAQLFEPPGPD